MNTVYLIEFVKDLIEPACNQQRIGPSVTITNAT
jgi:hypothetical protein